MDKERYFKDLMALLEATGIDGGEEVVQQEEIADSGSDLGPAPAEPVGAEENYDATEEEMPQEEFQVQETVPESSSKIEDILNSQKLTRLFSFYEELLNYCKLFLDSLVNVKTDLLELETFKLLEKYRRSTKELADKINTYMMDIYKSEEYEKLLYVYILFRTELVSYIKRVRDILKLDLKEDKKKDEH